MMALPREESNRAIITVLGHDQIGIIAWVSARLAENSVNILDISQTILNDFFTMIMVVDLNPANIELIALSNMLEAEGRNKGLQVKVQHEDIFAFMHRI
jgi:ACT domain-containing protein